ncbi:hypothetical protein AAG570_008725 [Ranatra chinensis]|uniref:Dynein heavy chain coiled coil stalk domain-containing protein n=1 Tax=Ranatra chinensis TaxID=642074 RepID=A0ABD0YRQ0_9HEMI
MLREAENSLKSLNKGDISEVRSLKRPPEGVVLVLESICIIKDIKPAKKVLSYWEPGRNMLADPGAFLNSLMNFNKAELTEALVVKLKPYIDNPNFRPAKIKLVSKACMSLCQWVHAMVNYYYVNLTVAPKKAALQEAQDRLEVVEIALAKSRARLKAVNL